MAYSFAEVEFKWGQISIFNDQNASFYLQFEAFWDLEEVQRGLKQKRLIQVGFVPQILMLVSLIGLLTHRI